jgi:hypothetical protein
LRSIDRTASLLARAVGASGRSAHLQLCSGCRGILICGVEGAVDMGAVGGRGRGGAGHGRAGGRAGVPLSRRGQEAQGSAEGPMQRGARARGRRGREPACDGRGRAGGRARRRVGVQSTGGVSCGSRRRRGPFLALEMAEGFCSARRSPAYPGSETARRGASGLGQALVAATTSASGCNCVLQQGPGFAWRRRRRWSLAGQLRRSRWLYTAHGGLGS